MKYFPQTPEKSERKFKNLLSEQRHSGLVVSKKNFIVYNLHSVEYCVMIMNIRTQKHYDQVNYENYY